MKVLPSDLVTVRHTPTPAPTTEQSTIMARYWQAAPKSPITCQTASAGMLIMVLQEAWVISHCFRELVMVDADAID